MPDLAAPVQAVGAAVENLVKVSTVVMSWDDDDDDDDNDDDDDDDEGPMSSCKSLCAQLLLLYN